MTSEPGPGAEAGRDLEAGSRAGAGSGSPAITEAGVAPMPVGSGHDRLVGDSRPDDNDQVPEVDDDLSDQPQDRDWAWVEEWRASGEPPAWAPGLTLAAFVALIVGLAVLVLSTGLADLPWLAVSANVLVAAGLAPALWLSRHLPVLRWISGGAALGVVVGWIAALIS